MFVHSVTAVMIASLTIAQTPVPNPAPAPAAQQMPVPPVSPTITVPAGTAVPLTLMNSVKSKSTKPGDTVRAVVAFPVTVGSRLAIPTGTFVEGTVIKVTAKPLKNQAPTLTVHFTRLLFPNGYSVALNGENTQSLLLPDENRTSTVEVAELTPMRLPSTHFAMGEGQQPTLSSFPQHGPNPAVVGGIAGGVTVGMIVGMLVWAHHHANSYDFVVFDVGWQFQMVLDSPVVLDASQVAAAAAAPNAN
jgi:hypothetical protein